MSYLKNYLCENKFKIIYIDNSIDIINYKEINYLEENKISLSLSNKTLCIKGKKLRINKLLENEILVIGCIESIEFKE